MLIVAAALLAGLLALRFRWPRRWGNLRAESVELAIGGNRVKLRADYSSIRIAHAVWAELATRKAGLAFDEDHDVISEIYDSWYALFGELRALMRSVPAEELRRSDHARQLVELIVQVLNGPLRRHLTRWQARFRNWYRIESDKGEAVDPQDLQRRYPLYDDLLSDLKEVNVELVALTRQLKELAHGG